MPRELRSDTTPTKQERQAINQAARNSYPKRDQAEDVAVVPDKPERRAKRKSSPGGIRSVDELQSLIQDATDELERVRRTGTDGQSLNRIRLLREELVGLYDELEVAKNLEEKRRQDSQRGKIEGRYAQLLEKGKRRVEVLGEVLPLLDTVEPLVQEICGLNSWLSNESHAVQNLASEHGLELGRCPGGVAVADAFHAHEFESLCDRLRAQGKGLLSSETSQEGGES